jgi:hypothetical protein
MRNDVLVATMTPPSAHARTVYPRVAPLRYVGLARSFTEARSRGGKVRQLRLHLLAQQTRVTYWLAPGRRVILRTVFRKTRSAESGEVARALDAQKICQSEHEPAHDIFDREVP